MLICNSLYNISAQNTIKGILKDQNTGEPLIGATVLIKGTTQGTITDFDGAFILRTSEQLPMFWNADTEDIL